MANATKQTSKCWPRRTAEKRIHEYARGWSKLELTLKMHASEQMNQRSITTSDIRWVLSNGSIVEGPVAATRGECKYKICGKIPNSTRTVCLVIIPNLRRPAISIVTAMWEDLS